MAVGGVLVRQLGTNAGVTQADPSVADKVLTDNGVGALPSFKNNFKFTTVAVSGQSDIVADSAADTLTVAAGSNITLTTVAGTDTLTIAAAGSGNVSTSATLTAGKTIIGAGTTVVDVSTLTATVANSTAGTLGTATPGTDYTALAFKTIAVSGQSDVVADTAADTLTFAGVAGVTITTDATTDTISISAAGLGTGTVTNTGTLTDHAVTVGNGGADISALPLATDTNQVLHGGVSADPTWEMPATPIVLQVDSTVAVDNCWVTSESLEIVAGKILTIDGGARVEITGPVATATPGQVLITKTMISGAVAPSIDWTVPTGYTHLRILFSGASDAALTSVLVNARFNGDTGANYDRQFINAVSTTVTANESLAQTSTSIGVVSGATAAAGNCGVCDCTILDYLGTTFHKSGVAVFQYKTSNASANFNVRQNAVSWRSTAAITSITLSLSSGNFAVGSVCSLYGLT